MQEVDFCTKDLWHDDWTARTEPALWISKGFKKS